MSSVASVLKVGICQMRSADNAETNIQFIREILAKSSSHAIDLITFPENCLFFRTSKTQQIESFDLEEPFWKEFEEWSKRNNCHLHFGSIAANSSARSLLMKKPEKEKKPFSNATVWIQPGEKAAVVYEKIHLFDIQLKSGQSESESELFERGKEKKVIEVKGWKVGLSICYDVRFADLYEAYAREQVDLILVPSAFLVETGKAHWEILLRARAIENQAFVVAAAQGGVHQGDHGARSTFGHSIAIEPWGAVIWEAQAEPTFKIVELELRVLETVRQQIPMVLHRTPFI